MGQAIRARVLHSEDVVQKKDSNLIFRLLELGLLADDGDDEDGEKATASDADGDADAAPVMAWWTESPPKTGEVHRWVVDGSYPVGLGATLSIHSFH